MSRNPWICVLVLVAVGALFAVSAAGATMGASMTAPGASLLNAATSPLAGAIPVIDGASNVSMAPGDVVSAITSAPAPGESRSTSFAAGSGPYLSELGEGGANSSPGNGTGLTLELDRSSTQYGETVRVMGSAPPGGPVVLLIDGRQAGETTAASGGAFGFLIETNRLSAGPHLLEAQAGTSRSGERPLQVTAIAPTLNLTAAPVVQNEKMFLQCEGNATVAGRPLAGAEIRLVFQRIGTVNCTTRDDGSFGLLVDTGVGTRTVTAEYVPGSLPLLAAASAPVTATIPGESEFPWLLVIGAIILVAIAGAGFVLWRRKRAPGPAPRITTPERPAQRPVKRESTRPAADGGHPRTPGQPAAQPTPPIVKPEPVVREDLKPATEGPLPLWRRKPAARPVPIVQPEPTPPEPVVREDPRAIAAGIATGTPRQGIVTLNRELVHRLETRTGEKDLHSLTARELRARLAERPYGSPFAEASFIYEEVAHIGRPATEEDRLRMINLFAAVINALEGEKD